jgi:hypothetical protein
MRAMMLVCAVVILLNGCTKAERAQFGGYGNNFKVTVYSGSEAVREFKSEGKVLSEDHTDGWYFLDAKTQKLVRVSGTVIVEQL